MRTAVVLLGLLAVAAVASADDDRSIISASCPRRGSTAGGWSSINLRDAREFANLAELVRTAAANFAADPANAAVLSRLACSPDDRDVELEYACQQATAGAVTYRIGFELECDDDDDDDRDDDWVQLEALVTVPTNGSQPTFNVTQKDVACPTFNSRRVDCYAGAYELDCDAYSPRFLGANNASGIVECEVYNRTVVGRPVYTFFCPVTTGNATRGPRAACDLPTTLPSGLRSDILAVLEQWSPVPRSGDFFDIDDDDFDDDSDDDDDDDDGNNTDNDGNNTDDDDDDDDNDDDRRRLARLF